MSVQATFDGVASRYTETVEKSLSFGGKKLEFFNVNKVHHLTRLVRAAGIELGSARVLDVGCGTGATDRILRPKVASLTGIDISTEMVATAKAAAGDIKYETYDGGVLPFAEESFDVAFSFNVFHHVPSADWYGLAAEMLRVLRPGGVAVVIEHNPVNPVTRKAVRHCPFDEDAVLVRPVRLSTAFEHSGGQRIAKWYILFAPVGGSLMNAVEKALWWLPLGGQYLFAASRALSEV